MNIKLSVHNLPPKITHEEFRDRFKDYQGFLAS